MTSRQFVSILPPWLEGWISSEPSKWQPNKVRIELTNIISHHLAPRILSHVSRKFDPFRPKDIWLSFWRILISAANGVPESPITQCKIVIDSVVMSKVIRTKCSVMSHGNAEQHEKSCNAMADWIEWKKPGHDNSDKIMERAANKCLEWMLCDWCVTCDWVELVMVRVNVFVQVNRSPDVEQPVLPVSQAIDHSEINDNLHQ